MWANFEQYFIDVSWFLVAAVKAEECVIFLKQSVVTVPSRVTSLVTRGGVFLYL